MQTEESHKAEPKRKTKTRILKLILAIAVVLILSVVFLVPVFVSSEKGREIILAKINDSLDGKTNFAGLSMSWWKGIRITDVSFNDSAGQIIVAIKQIATKPHYSSILTGGLSFGETTIDEPKIEINLKGRQAKKSQSPRQKKQNSKKAEPITLPVKKIDLVVNNGSLKVTNSKAETVQLSRINSRLKLRPPGQQTDFNIDMAVVNKDKKSKISAAGQIIPQRQAGWSLKGTSGELTVDVNDLDLASLGPIFALAGLDVQAEGIVSVNVKSEVKDGRFENLSAELKGRNLDVTAGQLKGDRLKSNFLDAAIKLQRKGETISIEKFEVRADWLTVQAGGAVPTTFKSLAEFVKADSIYNLTGNFECDLAAIMSQMPGTIGLKEGTKVTSGRLSGNIGTSTEAGQRQISGQATLAGLAGTVGGKQIALSEPVTAEVQITSDKAGVINFDKLKVSAPFAKVDCTGSSELLEYNAEVNLVKLQSELGQFVDIGPYKIAGELLSEGKVSSAKDKITAVGSFVVKELRLSSKDGTSAVEPKADIAFAVGIERDKGVLNVDFIKANASFGQVDIKDAVLPFGKETKKNMSLPVSVKLDLQKLQPFAVLFGTLSKEMQLAGTVESSILISSKKDSYRIVTDSTHIKNLKVSYPEKKPFEQKKVSVAFDVEVNPAQKAIAVRKLQLVSPQIKINKGEFSQVNKDGKTKLQGRVECEYDWSAVSAVAEPYLPEGLILEGQRKDTISFAAEYPAEEPDKLLANLNTKAKTGFAKAQYLGLNFGPTEVDVQVRNGLLTIAPFSTTVNNGQFNFAGEADFKRKPALFKTPGPIRIVKDIQINDQTTGKLLMYVNPIFANVLNVSGIANFNCEELAIPLTGDNEKDVVVIGTISINQLRLQASDLLGQILSVGGSGFQGQNITIHPTRFVLKDGFLRYDDMQMDVGDNPVVFGGVIGMDKSLDMTVTLPYTTSGRTVKVGEETAGERVTLSLKGTTDKPELDVGKLLQDQAIKKGLELLEGLFK